MKRCVPRAIAALGLSLWAAGLQAAPPPPIAAFARREAILDAALSPDGRYLALVETRHGAPIAVVKDLTVADGPFQLVMSSAADNRFFIDWCRWAGNTRLLCGFIAPVHEPGYIYIATRLVAVDADGRHMKVLVQGSGLASDQGQSQDRVVDWSPGKPDTVLVMAQASLLDYMDRNATGGVQIVAGATEEEYPSVYELDVNSGRMAVRVGPHRPLRHYLSDHHGNPRLGWGLVDNTLRTEVQVRDMKSNAWHRLESYEVFSRQRVLQPIAVCSDRPDCAYAIGESEGRNALWRIDLTGVAAPTLEFAHPAVDVDDPIFANDGRLLGVEYETDRPFIYFTDAERARVMGSLNAALPDAFLTIIDATPDGREYLVRATSDVDAGTYYLLDLRKGSLLRIGTAYPELDPAKLGRMRSIAYAAQDGTKIPGYLTVPPGVRAEKLPLVVMPHGGPIARQHWAFDFLRAFLVSRGYAVLQMNFRGSEGYGGQWFYAAHQDWGGLTYSDIADGARWAVKEGVADPAHLCIVGWSFGGYAALLGAVRDGELFRCSVSIAGVSDLSLLETQATHFINGAVEREQIGTDPAKLKAASPRNHAAELRIPLLMIHGDNDAQVNVEQSKAMDRALSKADKPHQFILIEGADHQMSRESDRTTLLTAIEKFLSVNLGPGAQVPD
jgi:dipeptidyl aminopeptidase/acylaminoacyl peptidase